MIHLNFYYFSSASFSAWLHFTYIIGLRHWKSSEKSPFFSPAWHINFFLFCIENATDILLMSPPFATILQPDELMFTTNPFCFNSLCNYKNLPNRHSGNYNFFLLLYAGTTNSSPVPFRLLHFLIWQNLFCATYPLTFLPFQATYFSSFLFFYTAETPSSLTAFTTILVIQSQESATNNTHSTSSLAALPNISFSRFTAHC